MQIERNFRRYMEGGRFETDFADSSRRVVAHPYAQGKETPGQSALCAGPGRVLVAVGPEGGWTDDEVALLESHGFERLSLGPRILRTDTAVVALLARLMPV